ncbi:regulator of G-protein signaling 5-like isoform X2 [Tubulanus polymorphus]|uniref:regulator of G-protein signaling 5-like isoform X2 n=1 Tax=Tubulanus polymorphus TaxID=672921 RepID=UPI003DA45139
MISAVTMLMATCREQCELATVEKGSPNGSDLEDERGPSKKSESKKKRNLGKEMKNRLRFLRRRHTDTTLGMKAAKMKDGQPGKPTAKEALDWGKSLEHLLNDRNGVQLFRSFLRTEFSDENLEFWIACEDYKSVGKGAKQGARAREIYNDYVAIQAPHEINLDSDTRAAVAKVMDNPNKHTFELAQKRIQALMEKDSYPRFLKSDVYISLTGQDT